MKRKALFGLVLGTALAVAPAAYAAVPIASDTGGRSPAIAQPAAMSQPEYQALLARSEALNQRYGNAVTRLSPQQFTALYQAGADRLTPEELAGIVARSEALNERYGIIGGPATRATPTTTTTTTGGDSFAWGTAAAGVGTLAGVALLALASLAVVRRRHRLSF